MKQKGKVLAISKEHNRVKISYDKIDEEDGSTTTTEKWFDVGGKVKMEFIRKEECEFESSKDNEDEIVFISHPKKAEEKPVKGEFKPATEFQPRGFDVAWDKVKQGRISRSGALNTAIELKRLNLGQSKDGIKEEVTAGQVIDIAKEFMDYIEGE